MHTLRTVTADIILSLALSWLALCQSRPAPATTTKTTTSTTTTTPTTPTPPATPPPVSKPGLGGLIPLDRLEIRETQLGLAQAHIARLQAEAQVKSYEDQIGRLIDSFRTEYGCPACTLDANFLWVKPAAPAPLAAPDPPEETGTAAPPDPKAGGQTSKKE
jgi:hypothetical protein